MITRGNQATSIRTSTRAMPDKQWRKHWEKHTKEGRHAFARDNVPAYVSTLTLQYQKGELSIEELQHELQILASHPDEKAAFSALAAPQTAFLCSQYLKAGEQNYSEYYKLQIGALDPKIVKLQAEIWDQVVKRAQTDLENENTALTPLAGWLINAAHSTTNSFFPKEAPNNQILDDDPKPWGPSKTAAQGARYLGKELEQIVERFADWATHNATPETRDDLDDMDAGDLERVIWENGTFIKQLSQEVKQLATGHPGRLIRQLVPNPLASAGAFQNPNLNMDDARQIAFWLATQNTEVDPYPHCSPGFKPEHCDRFIFAFSQAGGTLTQKQVELISGLITKKAGENAPRGMNLRTLTLFPQACQHPVIREEILKETTDDTKILRFALNGPSGDWSKAALDSARWGNKHVKQQAGEIVNTRARDVTAADIPNLIAMAAGNDEAVRASARTALAATATPKKAKRTV